ncbi:hypothetical protein, partial [Desulfosporosinus nitroreducens]
MGHKKTPPCNRQFLLFKLSTTRGAYHNRLRGFLHGVAYFCEMYQIDNESEMGQLIVILCAVPALRSF